MRAQWFFLFLFLCGGLLVAGGGSGRADPALQNILNAPSVTVRDIVLDRAALAAVYEPRDYALLWTRREQAAALLSAFNGAAAHGLNPQDYHAPEIAAYLDGKDTGNNSRRLLDILLTDGLMRYASDLRAGRVSPRQVRGERFSNLRQIDPVAVVAAAGKSPDLPAYLAGLVPPSPVYAGLVRALAVLRAQQVAGGWPQISEGRKLEPGTSSPRIITLRQRLAASGELGPARPGENPLYDPDLVRAVKAYQVRSGLEADGVIGRATIAALNVPVDLRIDQVRANMERLRWQADDLGQRYVYVNIPAYRLVAVTDGRVDLNMKVIVGRVKRPTPVFSDAIRLVEFNPDWHVPPTIAREDVLPNLVEDPGYALEHKNVRIYQDGEEVDPYTVDWSTADIRAYRLRAEPGPRNPLGTVKFLFPNRFDVYLHDTNEHNLFAKDLRAISSGCVRVEDSAALTNWLLGPDRADWNEEKRMQILDSRRQTRLVMKTPVPVHLAYITAWLDEDGVPVFRDDIYGQDKILIAALQQADVKARRLVASMVRAPDGQGAVSPDVPPEEVIRAAP